jgi:NAD(P)-dependent dehydrogenase (short-subunit alcohol dehydrogenase family)
MTTSKTILITGSTDGVGRRVAQRLAAPGTTLILHGRSSDRAGVVAEEVRKSGGTVFFYTADLASLAEVRGLAQRLQQEHKRLDVLINNAGIGTSNGGSERQLSLDGYELRFAVNYLSGFLLTHLLLPTLKASQPSRIVNVSSLGQQAIDFDDVMLTRGYSGMRAYCQSKLAQILFTIDLAEALKGSGVTVTSLHPATYMDTTMVRASGVTPTSTVDQGADAIIQLAVADQTAGESGVFYNQMHPSKANAQAYDARARERLRTLSLELVGLAGQA